MAQKETVSGFYEENGVTGSPVFRISIQTFKYALKTNKWNTLRLGNWFKNEVLDYHSNPTLIDTVHQRGFISLQIHHAMKPEDQDKVIKWKNIRIISNPKKKTRWIGILL